MIYELPLGETFSDLNLLIFPAITRFLGRAALRNGDSLQIPGTMAWIFRSLDL